MSKVTVFCLILSKFFVDLFLGTSYFSPIYLTKISLAPAYYSFDFLDLITDFLDSLDLKTGFSDLENFFKLKKIFFRLFRRKNFF